MGLTSISISSRWTSALLLPAALIAPAPGLQAQAEEDDTYMGENPDRYASVRILEGEATIRKGEVEEPLDRGIPIAEGDVVESHGRGILQLADGTRVAFGSDTQFQVASLFVDQEEQQQVLLRLDYGRLRVAMGRESQAQIRIDMPSGSAILSDGASVGLEMERDRTARVKVFSGRIDFHNERDKASLLAGERLTVYSAQDRLDRIQNVNTYGSDSFEAWSDRNLTVRRGPSWEKVPPEIRYYSDDLDENGEWVYVEEYRTWCWRPLRVSAEWRPYWRGRWGAYPGGMTWISDEPWGYVTYHHGRWGWGAGLGWYWIPGVYYSPAWVAWDSSDAYFGWAPMGYRNHPVSWGFGAWGGGICWNVVEINFIYTPRIHTRTHHDSGVIRTFNSGSGSTRWNSGSRPLSTPWRQSPLVVSQNEFRNPAQMHRILQDPNAARDRLHTYEQKSGRTIYRRPAAALPLQGANGFEDRGRLPERPIQRKQPSEAGSRPLIRPYNPMPAPLANNRTAPGTNALPPPITQPSTGRPLKPIPREQAIQPSPVQPPRIQPPSARSGGPGSGGQRDQPRAAPGTSQQQTPNGSPPPPIWPKPKRPLGRP